MDKIREDLSNLASGECSLPISLEVIGERWCFMILRAALNGVGHFEDFLSQIGIARNILANRLTRMVEAGIMTRRPCENGKPACRPIRYCAIRATAGRFGGSACGRMMTEFSNSTICAGSTKRN